MEYGIITQSVVSVRETPSEKSQMVNQLLFGDLFLIKSKKADWYLIETVYDNFEGWVFKLQVTAISESFFQKAVGSTGYFVHSLYGMAKGKNRNFPLLRGAQLPLWEQGNFQIEEEEYYYKKAVHAPPLMPTGSDIITVAKGYLEAPYLWGGRSPFGIDSPGLVQIVFKMNGIMLPREAAHQVEKGEQILFVEAAHSGDIAFFESNDGTINHSGIVLNGNRIIHSWGKVRIDSLDHQGIFNNELKAYTHRLRLVKSILSR